MVEISDRDTAADLEITLGHLADRASRLPDEGPRRAAHPSSAKSQAHRDINQVLDAWQARTALEAGPEAWVARLDSAVRKSRPSRTLDA